MELIRSAVNQIVSIIIPEGVAWLKEHHDQKKRIERLKAALISLLQNEQSNLYYNDLTYVLTNSRLLQDVLKGCTTGQPATDIDTRIDDLLLQEKINEPAKSYLRDVINRMIESIQSIMLTPSEGAETRLTYRYNDLQNQLSDTHEHLKSIDSHLANEQRNNLCLSEIQSYCEPLLDGSGMISRKLIRIKTDGTDDSKLSWIDVLQSQRRIAIVSDAGVGKTYALHQLCHFAKTQGYYPVYLSLNKYPGIPLLEKLSNGYFADCQKVVLVLDGYDEVKPECLSQFNSTLEGINNRLSDMTIILSSRSNFFAHYPLQYEQFGLANITDQEHIEYVEGKGIDPDSFLSQIQEHNLEEMCKNVFCFVELVQLWQKHNTLPDEADIMEAIIDSRIRSDKEKYKLSIPELSEHTASLRKLFERISFIMQCTHRLQLTTSEMRQICTEEECKQLKHHGLWEDNFNGDWTFVHNNFREYFAACWLIKQPIDQIISYISWSPNNPKVKPSWMNVLSYMAKMKHSYDLQAWIVSNDPAIVTLFERERFPRQERFAIFKRIYERHEEEMTWADVDYEAYKRMGAFASCHESVEYILDKLTSGSHMRQEKNLLRILALFDSFYGQEEKCKSVISEIAFDSNYPDHMRADALYVMRRFPRIFIEYTSKAAELSMQSDSIDYRYHLQRFIEATGMLDDYFEIIMHELSQSEKEDDACNLSRKLFLDHICSTIQSDKNVLRLFEFANAHPECINVDPFCKAWPHLFDVAICCHDSLRKKFSSAVLQLFSVVQRRYYSDLDELIKKYMVATRSEDFFLVNLLSFRDNYAISYAIQSLSCPSFIDILIDYYNADRLSDFEIIKQVVKLLPPTDPMQSRLVKAVYLKSRIDISVSENGDRIELRRKGYQKYFDTLFSKDTFAALVDELCCLLGKETPVKAKNRVVCEPFDRKTALAQCLRALQNAVPAGSKLTLGTVVEWIKDWDLFQYNNIIRFIIGAYEVSVSNTQMAWIENYTHRKLSEINTDEIRRKYFDEQRFDQTLQFVLKTVIKLNMSLPLDLLCPLVLIPSMLFGESNPTAFPKYLLDHISKEEMINLVLYNIQNEDLRECTAAAHLTYCTEHKLLGAKDFAINFLRKDESEGYRYPALHYISELYGDDVIIDEIAPLRKDVRFLLDVAAHIPRHRSAPLLDAKLESLLLQTPIPHLQELMIRRNQRVALEVYYQHAEEIRTLPDMTEGDMLPSLTEAIKYVDSIALIDVVIKLLRLSNQPDFLDKKQFGLKWSCCEAIKAMAAEHYDDVRVALDQERRQVSGNQKLTCTDLLQEIDTHYRFSVDKGIPFELALALTAT